MSNEVMDQMLSFSKIVLDHEYTNMNLHPILMDIEQDGKLSNKTLLAEMGSDGMTLDHKGNIYLTGDGVTVFDPSGKKILHIPIPQDWTANVTFGGKEQKTLFITAMNSLYSLEMNVHGVR